MKASCCTTIVALVSLLAALVYGCQSKSSNAEADRRQQAQTGEHDTMFDRQFIDMMTPHHESGVEMLRLAQSRAEHRELKDLAERSIQTHLNEIAQLKSWRGQWFGSSETPPKHAMPLLPGMRPHAMPDMEKQMSSLRDAQGFDKAFIEAMIPHHEMAIDAGQVGLREATRPELKSFAANVAKQQRQDVEQLKVWQSAW